ncbi:hypothetical protein [Candidatus Williamhamiltonella defendens]|uniref:hypothetical protein n=1 Tax=Candidatus Williamhamiltonella defendens TaxID=138072 RepID=UPI00165109B3|nr:hypothetical protein [Candidatus Hamiltonella defensa]
MKYQKSNNIKLNINWGAKDYRKREVMKPFSHMPPVPGYQTKFDLRTGLKMSLI